MSLAVFVLAVALQGSPTNCTEPQACSELALEARARGAHETFHDLAWRAVQTGTPNDPDLLYLLARAQALSGRRRDAVVTLRRLAEAGVANDAATEEDFRRVRELPDWAYIASLATRARPAAPSATAKPAPTAKPPAPSAAPTASAAKPATAAVAPAGSAIAPPGASVAPTAPTGATVAPIAPAGSAIAPSGARAAPAASALRVDRARVEDAVRFSTPTFTPAGLAYDAVSRRFLFGDLTGRRLFVAGEGSDRTVDLVRADSAGFEDVTALTLDTRRGELWVASTAADARGGAIHRLQLISGRPLATLAVKGSAPVRLTDLAVAGDGTVLVLDSGTPRLLIRRPGATTLDVLMSLTMTTPASLTVDESGRFAYVAHRDGITRIDTEARRAAAVKAATGIALAGFDSIRWHRDGLVGSQRQPDRSHGLIRLQFNRDRNTVTAATLIDSPSSSVDDRIISTTSGDDLYYLIARRAEGAAPGVMNVEVRRIRLR
jgi:hypothetical protein